MSEQTWQTVVVDNHMDTRGCQKLNSVRDRSGGIVMLATSSGTVVDSNESYESDGIWFGTNYRTGASAQVQLHYFDEIRDNLIDDEYLFMR